MFRNLVGGLVGLTLLANAADVQAGLITTFTDRATFDTAFPTTQIENWDGFAAGTTFPNGSTVNGITYNSSTNIAVVADGVFVSSTPPNVLGRTTTQVFDPTDTISFTFSGSINVFGIDFNTFATTDGTYTATTNLGDLALSGFDPFPGFSTGQFVGFLADTLFTTVTIAGPGAGGFAYQLDTMRFGIPEPSTLALFAIGLAGMGIVTRRRRKAA